MKQARSLFLLLSLSFLSSVLHSEEAKGVKMIENKATIPILTPSLAERKFAKLQLENGLMVYLISDPGAEQSAASVTVEAGSWQDPKTYPGMAHFLEHMLFMGTAAYPKEFEYMQYIADHGGHVNAATWPDHTIYMFSINNEAFEGALDRFSHFFIDPLLNPSSISRELHAVDQEHAKNIENDGWREYMIFKETGNPAHPNAAFSTGNAQTLGGIPQKSLREWYQKHYAAQKMHLILLSPLPLETLISLAAQDFSKVPNPTLPEASSAPQMLSNKQMGHLLYIKPVKDLRRLSLVWEVPTAFALDKDKKALELIAYALKNGSENSLLEELKREKIAEDIDVEKDRFSKGQLLFRIDISLTEQGVKQIDTAITRCFQAIARLKEKGVPAYLFDEMRQLALLDYQYQSREDAFHFITEYGNKILYEDFQTFPEKTKIPSQYDPSFVSSFLEILKPQSCIYVVMADPALTGVTPTTKEKWMSAEYAFKDIPQTKLIAWNQAKLHPEIQLPPSNPYLPTQLATLSQKGEATLPQLLADDAGAKVYFAPDTQYLVPEVAAFFSFKTPSLDGSAKKIVLTDLYLRALSEKLSPTLFFAQTAGLHPQFSQGKLKLSLTVNGYNEKAPLLLKEIFQSLKTAIPTQEQFAIYKESLLSHYDNASQELPVAQAIDLLSSIIYSDAPTFVEKQKALQTITYAEFVQFAQGLFNKAYVEGFVYGSISQADAQELWADLKTTLTYEPYPLAEQNKRHILLLPEKQGPYMISQQTGRQGNGVVLLLEEGAFSFDKRGMQQILGKALQEGFFDTLRTKQQTAYIAKAWESEVERQLFQYFAVQSSTHHPRDLIARFDLFLEDFDKNLTERISAERFETLRTMLITTLQMPPENLTAMGVRLNTLAFECEGDFSWYNKRIESLKALSYEKLIQTAHQFLSRENPRRLAVLVEGVLHPDNDFHYEAMTRDDVRDLGTYVSWR